VAVDDDEDSFRSTRWWTGNEETRPGARRGRTFTGSGAVLVTGKEARRGQSVDVDVIQK
jgi:hypothetical protein